MHMMKTLLAEMLILEFKKLKRRKLFLVLLSVIVISAVIQHLMGNRTYDAVAYGETLGFFLHNGLIAFFGKGHGPCGAFAFCKVAVVAVGIALAFENGNDGISGQRLREVVKQAPLVLPALLGFLFLVNQSDGNAGHEYGFAAQ